MSRPVLYGAPYSVYVRAVRLALAEKGVAYRLVPIDIFDPARVPKGYRRRQPFGRIPAFAHDGFELYESVAIERYVDEAFAGPKLQPDTATGRARMAQIVAVADGHGYRPLVWDLYVERVLRPAQGRPVDEARAAAAIPKAVTFLAALAALKGEGAWMVGDGLSLADLHLAPIFAYFTMLPAAAGLIAPHPGLVAWLQAMRQRPSMAQTRFPDEIDAAGGSRGIAPAG